MLKTFFRNEKNLFHSKIQLVSLYQHLLQLFVIIMTICIKLLYDRIKNIKT